MRANAYHRDAEGCPHGRLGPEEDWPLARTVIATCRDCGTTISVRPISVEPIVLVDHLSHLEEEITDDDSVVAWPAPYDEVDFYGSEYPQEVGYKPYGVWYGCGNDWLDRVVYGDERPSRSKHYVYRLEIEKRDLIIISNERQLLEFSQRYALGPFDVDWPAVARVAKGIEICPYQYQLKDKLDWYNPWDVASGCVWDPSAVIGIVGALPID